VLTNHRFTCSNYSEIIEYNPCPENILTFKRFKRMIPLPNEDLTTPIHITAGDLLYNIDIIPEDNLRYIMKIPTLSLPE
jgi:hypothetical protein